KEYEAKSPNIGPFFKHGGKLILWHGFDDPGPSPLATIEYYQKVEKATGAAANSDLRFYLLPGCTTVAVARAPINSTRWPQSMRGWTRGRHRRRCSRPARTTSCPGHCADIPLCPTTKVVETRGRPRASSAGRPETAADRPPWGPRASIAVLKMC